jgi:hypothetical protein
MHLDKNTQFQQNLHLRPLVLQPHLRNTYGTQSVADFNSLNGFPAAKALTSPPAKASPELFVPATASSPSTLTACVLTSSGLLEAEVVG